ncbi:MAG: hypothetical protein ACRDZX_08130, partial [Acidimicrobiales bacterium]
AQLGHSKACRVQGFDVVGERVQRAAQLVGCRYQVEQFAFLPQIRCRTLVAGSEDVKGGISVAGSIACR